LTQSISSKKEQLISDYTRSPQTKAEQGLVDTGNRAKATVLALKIKNKINHEAEKFLEQKMEHLYQKKGAVYRQEGFIFAVFTQSMTKMENNEVRASNAAEKIASELKEYNRKFREKIEWGIGINSGEIICSLQGQKLQFTALGSTIVAAKKLADLADKKIMLTSSAFAKASAEIKAEKQIINGVEYYTIKQIMDLEKNKKFIDDFMKREGRIK